MKKKVEYTVEPMGECEIVEDFLPPPEELVFKEDDTTAITIELSTRNIEFFKKEAKKRKTDYKEMIRGVLEKYTLRYDKH